MSRVRLGHVAVLLSATIAIAAMPTVASAKSSARTCSFVTIPVALAEGEPQSADVWAEHCRPRGANPRTVQLLVHGATYNHTYWDFPINAPWYSYVDAAVEAGYAVLNIDRIGTGNSTKPPSDQVTWTTSIFALHQVVQWLRSDERGNPYDKVEYVGHSFGSAYGVGLAATFGDVDALILTGYGNTVSPAFSALARASVWPANNLARFADLDDGYLTNREGTVAAQHYFTLTTDPRVIERDEETTDLLALAEIQTRPSTAELTLQIDVPTFLVTGAKDVHYCAPDNVAAVDCTSQQSHHAAEARHFSPAARLRTWLVPFTGHNLNLHLTAPLVQQVMLAWSRSIIPPGTY